MTGSPTSGAYHIPTVLEGSNRGWSSVVIPIVTAAIVVALGFLMIAVTTSGDESNVNSFPAAAAENQR